MKACPNCQASYPTNFTHCPQDGTPLVGAVAWGEGTVVRGKYRILGKVGKGGMATVYKAIHTRFGELRALKVMNPELAGDEAFVKRFMREAVLTRKLLHPNAVRVDDIDESEDGRPFIVMEYIEGRSLREAIQAEAPLPLGRVCPIIIQVASALDAAHRLGIVHRDIKPGNIVLLAPGSPSHSGPTPAPEWAKVLDFGIAKAKEIQFDESLSSHATLTGTGGVIGTPAYMSPEQARGIKGDELDGRSDLYSLGIVMYQMLAGGLPFKADTGMEWILAHLQTPPKPLWEACPDVRIPPPVGELVMRCLEKDRELRPASAAVLIEHLKRAQPQNQSSSSGPMRLFLPDIGPVELAPIRRASQRPAPPLAPAARATPQVAREVRQAAPTPRPSRTWKVGMIAIAFMLLLAVAVWFWRTQRLASLSNLGSPARTEVPNAAGPARPRASKEASGPSSPPPAGTPVPNAPPSSQGGESASSKAKTMTEAPANPPGAAPGGARETGPSPGAEAAAAERLAEALRKERVEDAVARAQDDENRGDFEEALKEYQRASSIDPADARLKANVKRLQTVIEKEKELIK